VGKQDAAGSGGRVTQAAELGSSPPRLEDPRAPRPSFAVQVVALDLDGTTIDFEQRLHPRTKTAVRATVSRGVPVVAVTGRMYRSALPWAMELGLHTPLICYQGAMVRAMPEAGAALRDGVPQGRLLTEDALYGEACALAIELARVGGWHVQGYRDDRLLCEREGPDADFYSRIAGVAYELVDDLAAALAEGSTKVVCVALEEARAAACEAAMRARLGANARVVRSMNEFVEITNPVAGKGRALRFVCELLGVPVEAVVAAGDAPNDADMLAVAGYAVAVEDADPAALAVADAVIPGPAGAGVAVLLETLGLT
jgi:hydroxymethylpyrimidine pyrophosphatase-like HAD family hydrolase